MQIKVCRYIFESFIFFTIFLNKAKRKRDIIETKTFIYAIKSCKEIHDAQTKTPLPWAEQRVTFEKQKAEKTAKQITLTHA